MTPDMIAQLAHNAAERRESALCTIVATDGSTPLKAGAKMLVRSDGTTHGTVGGGALERSVIGQALAAIEQGEGGLFAHRLVRDHNMCCGGTVHVFIEPIPIPRQLFIFGAGHIGAALAAISATLPFQTTVIDDRPGVFEPFHMPNARLINEHPRTAMPALICDSRTFVVIATYSHPLDREILAYMIRQPLAYCGMIASSRKATITRKLFLEQRYATDEQLAAVDMPIGVAIGAAAPGEIAVSIAARLIEVKNRGLESRPRRQHGLPDRNEAKESAPCTAANMQIANGEVQTANKFQTSDFRIQNS